MKRVSYFDLITRGSPAQSALRPLAPDPTGKRVISPVDGEVCKISDKVNRKTAFEIKGEQYSLTDLLAEDANSRWLQPFVDGMAVQIFLKPSDYHRWHSPVTGRITKVRTVPGYFFAQPSPGDLSTMPKDQLYKEVFSFLSHVNTRTIVFIEPENPAIGEIALIFVGLTEVSSCRATVQEGDSVQRGDELGHFAFGGSTCCILFDRSKITRSCIKVEKEVEKEVRVRQDIASAL
jgi:phosphatidylserine decarboxylase